MALNKNALDVTKVHDESIGIQFALHGNLQMQFISMHYSNVIVVSMERLSESLEMIVPTYSSPCTQ